MKMKLLLASALCVFIFSCSNNTNQSSTRSQIETNKQDSIINVCYQQNIFDIVQSSSKSSPTTLEGTNNDYWIVYYEDIDITFKTTKSNDLIIKVKKGKNPNL